MEVLREVRCKWASVTEPNTTFTPRWEIVALLDEAQAAVLADKGLKVKTEEDGTFSFRFKQNCKGTKRDGSSFDKEAPRVVDASAEPFTGNIGNGSLVNISYNMRSGAVGGTPYTTADLRGVQVLELVPYQDPIFKNEGETKIIEEPPMETSSKDAPDDDLPY